MKNIHILSINLFIGCTTIRNLKKKNIKLKEKNYLLHSLGNLVLLSRSKNSELQNFDFPYKKKHKKEVAVEGGQE